MTRSCDLPGRISSRLKRYAHRMSVERFVVALGADGTLAIPAELRQLLDLNQPGTLVEISLDESKTVLRMRRYGVMDPDQAWYWTPE